MLFVKLFVNPMGFSEFCYARRYLPFVWIQREMVVRR